MPKILIALGLILVAAGLVWLFAERLGLGHLPGDMIIKREWGDDLHPHHHLSRHQYHFECSFLDREQVEQLNAKIAVRRPKG